MLAVGANSTAIMAALPTMHIELSLSSAGVEWAVNAYLVASAACIVLGGRRTGLARGQHQWSDSRCSASRPASSPLLMRNLRC
jgi:hypothetical protein